MYFGTDKKFSSPLRKRVFLFQEREIAYRERYFQQFVPGLMFFPDEEFIGSCPICGKSFDTQTRLKSHIEYCRRASNPQFGCSVCGKTFAYRKDLEKHFRKHTGERPYKCESCNYSSGDPSSLLKHQRRHFANS